MRIVCLALVGIFCCTGCKKDNRMVLSNGELVISDGETDGSNTIDQKACLETAYKDDHVTLCFDSLIEDSRCPSDALCIWQGRAVVKFSFTVNQDQRHLTLSTLTLPGIMNSPPSDTILMGYKIAFVNLLPYPKVNEIHNISEYRAQLKITKQ